MYITSLQSFKRLAYYFTFSCLSAILDLFIVTTLFNLFLINYILANTIGIVAGFIIHFVLSSKRVFSTNIDIKSFAVYLLTFLLGLVTANSVLFISFKVFQLSFYISKLISMALPFFITYFLRTIAYRSIEGLRYGQQRI